MFATALARDHRTPLPDCREIAGQLEDIFPGGHRMLQPTLVDPSTGLTLSAWLRLDNPDELAAALGDQPRPLQVATAQWERGDARSSRSAGHQASDIKAVFPLYEDKEPDPRFARDAALVLAAYRKWGPDCAVHFEGDFSFVILDPRDGSAYAARDAVGIRPLYIAVTDEVFAASPSSAVFDLIPGVDISVRWEWLADYIHGMSGDWRETPFVGVKRLPPGHWLRVTQNNVTEQRYHEFSGDSPWEDTREPRWLEAYRNELIRAVSVRAEPEGLIGVETSGGLDSSSILGVLAHSRPDRVDDIHTFGFALYESEPSFILSTSIAHGLVHNHILTGVVAEQFDYPRSWRAVGYPPEHPNAVSHMPFYELGHNLGVANLHSGHGGDEAVTNSGALALQELHARRRWKQLLQDLPGRRTMRPWRMLQQIARRPGQISSLTAPMMSRLEATPLAAEIVDQRDLRVRTFRNARHSAPYNRVNDFILGSRFSMMTSIRTSDCSLVAATFGVEYRWPLLDRQLIAQYLGTPSVWKYGEGFGRYLHRRAIAGLVPCEVAWKPSKSMGSPMVPELRQIPAVRAADLLQPGTRDRSDAYLANLHPTLSELVDHSRVRQLFLMRRLGQYDTLGLAATQFLADARLLSDWMYDRENV